MSLPSPGPVALRAVDDALAVVGTKEDGPPYENAGPQVAIYLSTVGLGTGYPWCAAFVCYRELRAAHELAIDLPPDFPRGTFAAAAANWAHWAQENGRWIGADTGTVPGRGDLCCFDIPSENGIHHIGMVVSADAHGVVTVEGNTHPDGAPTRDGYCVAERHRSYGDFGPHGGFVRLPY